MKLKFALGAVIAASLAACGGGGGSGSGPKPTESARTERVTGTAAKGAPVATGAAVEAFCADGLSYSSSIKLDGQFTVMVGEGALPCGIRIDGMVSITGPVVNSGFLHVNVTPITNMIVLKHLGADADSLFSGAGKAKLLSFSQKTSGDGFVAFLNNAGYKLNPETPEFGQGFFDQAFLPNPEVSAHDFLIERIKAAGGFEAAGVDAFNMDDPAKFPGGSSSGGDTGGGDTGGGDTGGGDTGGGDTGGGDTGGGDTGGGDTGGGDTGGGDTGGGDTGGGDTGGGDTGGGDTGGGSVTANEIAFDSCKVTQKQKADGALPGVEIKEVSWLQTVQMNALDGSARLASGKDAFLRIDLINSGAAVAFPSDLFLGVHNEASGNCERVAFAAAPAGDIPGQVAPGVLTKSLFAKIPASLVKSGMSVLFVASPNAEVDAAAASRLVFKSRVATAAAITDEIHLLEVVIDGKQGYFPGLPEFKTLFDRLFPVANASLVRDGTFIPDVAASIVARPKDARGIYMATAQEAANLLSEISAYCARTYPTSGSNAAAKKCAGFWPDNVRFANVGGLAEVGGRAMVMASVNEVDRDVAIEDIKPYDRDGISWLNPFAETIAHEFGHIMSLNHANCGGAPGPFDARLYADGSIGPAGGGYDSVKGYFFSERHTPQAGEKVGFFDTMGYCFFGWMSDKGYQAIIDYKSDAAAKSASMRAAKQRNSGNKVFRIDLVGKSRLVTEVDSMPNDAASVTNLKLAALLKPLGGLKIFSMKTDIGVNQFGPFYIELPGGNAGKLIDAVLSMKK